MQRLCPFHLTAPFLMGSQQPPASHTNTRPQTHMRMKHKCICAQKPHTHKQRLHISSNPVMTAHPTFHPPFPVCVCVCLCLRFFCVQRTLKRLFIRRGLIVLPASSVSITIGATDRPAHGARPPFREAVSFLMRLCIVSKNS